MRLSQESLTAYMKVLRGFGENAFHVRKQSVRTSSGGSKHCRHSALFILVK